MKKRIITLLTVAALILCTACDSALTENKLTDSTTTQSTTVSATDTDSATTTAEVTTAPPSATTENAESTTPPDTAGETTTKSEETAVTTQKTQTSEKPVTEKTTENTTERTTVKTTAKTTVTTTVTTEDVTMPSSLTAANINDSGVIPYLAQKLCNSLYPYGTVLTYSYDKTAYKTSGKEEAIYLIALLNIDYLSDSTLDTLFGSYTKFDLERMAEGLYMFPWYNIKNKNDLDWDAYIIDSTPANYLENVENKTRTSIDTKDSTGIKAVEAAFYVNMTSVYYIDNCPPVIQFMLTGYLNITKSFFPTEEIANHWTVSEDAIIKYAKTFYDRVHA